MEENISPTSAISALHDDVTSVCGQHCADASETGISQDPGQHSAGQSFAELIRHDQGRGVTPAESAHAENNFTFSQISTRQKYIFVLFCLNDVSTGCAMSILAPFFPREAALKGVSLTVTGLIMGTDSLALLVACPVAGSLMTRIGPKFMCASGSIVSGMCLVLMGFLDKGPPGSSFIITCFLIRLVEGVAVAAFVISSYAMVTLTFPDHMATVLAARQGCRSVGMICGPSVGTLLYELSGFGLPFWAVGVYTVCVAVIMAVYLPPTDCCLKQGGSMFSLLNSSRVCVAMVTLWMAPLAVSFVQTTLSHHLETFEATTVYIGLAFVMVVVLDVAALPVWGYLTDRRHMSEHLIVFGNVCGALAFLSMGPTPLLPLLNHQLWCVVLGLVLYGTSLGCRTVPCISQITQGTIMELGLPNDINTHSLFTGLFMFFYTLGYITGSGVGGWMVDHWGFASSATAVAGLFTVVAAGSSVYFIVMRYREKTRAVGEDTHLLVLQSTNIK